MEPEKLGELNSSTYSMFFLGKPVVASTQLTSKPENLGDWDPWELAVCEACCWLWALVLSLLRGLRWSGLQGWLDIGPYAVVSL